MRRTAAVLAAVALVTGGCADSSTSDTTSGAGSTSPQPTTVDDTDVGPATSTTLPALASAFESPALTGQEAELAAARVANGGRLPADVGLDLFAAGAGELPGADPERFQSDGDLTMALRAVLANWDTYSDEQRAAVRAALGYPIAQGVRSGTSAAAPADPALQARVDAAVARIGELMGVVLSFPITVATVPGLSDEGTPVNGLTWVERAGELVASGQADRCRIHLTDGVSDRTIAHEVFHCFQADLAADVADVFGGEDWLIEGSASWAGATVAGIDDFAVELFQTWALHADSVFQLDYPAIGFFWSVEDMGVSPWEVVPAMLGKSGVEAVAATGLAPEKVLTHLAAIISRAHTTSPIPVSDAWDFRIDVPPWGERTDLVVGPGNGLDEAVAGAFFAKGMNLHITVEDASRVRVLMDSDVGTLEFFERSPITWAQRLGREFCIDPAGCTCGAGGSTDSGLEQGGPDLVVVPGEVGAGPMRYRIEVADDVFSDGTWTGTVTSSVLTVTDGATSGERASTTFPFELTVADGAVTAGSFTIGFPAEVTTATGTGQGVLAIFGGFSGCGFAPQFQGSSLRFDGTMSIPGGTLPLTFSNPIPEGSGGLDTVWIPGPIIGPDVRSGTIDAGGSIGAIAAGGFTANDLQLTFEATRSP